MRALEILAERRIQEAMDEGFFDDLPGRGEPLDMSENPFEDPGARMAHRILRNSGHTLPWIEESREIVRAMADARAALRATPAAIAVFRVRAAEINRRVLDFNVRAPVRGVELLTMNVEAEIAAAEAGARMPDPKPVPPSDTPLSIWQSFRRRLRRRGGTAGSPTSERL
jgi:hypothetical protein